MDVATVLILSCIPRDYYVLWGDRVQITVNHYQCEKSENIYQNAFVILFCLINISRHKICARSLSTCFGRWYDYKHFFYNFRDHTIDLGDRHTCWNCLGSTKFLLRNQYQCNAETEVWILQYHMHHADVVIQSRRSRLAKFMISNEMFPFNNYYHSEHFKIMLIVKIMQRLTLFKIHVSRIKITWNVPAKQSSYL